MSEERLRVRAGQQASGVDRLGCGLIASERLQLGIVAIGTYADDTKLNGNTRNAQTWRVGSAGDEPALAPACAADW
jgi:hypothetical protein